MGLRPVRACAIEMMAASASPPYDIARLSGPAECVPRLVRAVRPDYRRRHRLNQEDGAGACARRYNQMPEPKWGTHFDGQPAPNGRLPVSRPTSVPAVRGPKGLPVDVYGLGVPAAAEAGSNGLMRCPDKIAARKARARKSGDHVGRSRADSAQQLKRFDATAGGRDAKTEQSSASRPSSSVDLVKGVSGLTIEIHAASRVHFFSSIRAERRGRRRRRIPPVWADGCEPAPPTGAQTCKSSATSAPMPVGPDDLKKKSRS